MHEPQPSDPALVSVTECARRLASAGDPVERSALSRYVKRYALARGGKRGETLVDPDEVAAHRRENFTREIMSGGRAIPAPGTRSAAHKAADIVDIDPKRRAAAAQAEKLELELEERKGTLVAIADVEAALAQAVSTWRTALAEDVAETAAQLVAELGASADHIRPARAVLKRAARRAEARLRDAFAALAADMRQPEGMTRTRLDRLAREAHRARTAAGTTTRT